MVYNWKINLSVKAQDVGEHFEQLEKQFGKVTPKTVLESARPEGSLLHPCLEWNDEVAAEKYRENQAGHIIRNLVVKVENHEQPTFVRAFINIKTQTDSSFMSITKVFADNNLRDQMLESAKRELKMFRDKYANLSELSRVFDVIDAFE